ncbi:FtsK/SpoIIIE domain-containing protein [Psychromicrobium xiongbiense]|uniref:FtsK/SpoIIIE domain-containing protein n=1 Tax=Psychromicrobium xiongbiense TaxID=3051184 RepID=UPI00255475E7|nr:FtsK/SpoIIIE domain-containing protein [Psychromicrobium sp. YIM S02556]
MSTQFTVVDQSGARAVDVVVDAVPEADAGLVLRAVAGDAVALVAGAGVAWAASGVCDGAVVDAEGVLSRRVDTGAVQAGRVQVLRVAGDAGSVFSLGPGRASIGSGEDCSIVLAGEGMPSLAAVVDIGPDGVWVERAQADVELELSSEPVLVRARWADGEILRLGQVLLALQAVPVEAASLKASEDVGKLDFNRPPRLFPPARNTKFRLPAEPKEEGKRSLPLVMMLAPLAVSVGIAVVMGRPMYLLFGLLSPVLMISNYFQSKKAGKEGYRDRVRAYRASKRTIEADARAALVAFAKERRLLSPDPATVGLIATTPSTRLWERRRTSPDYLSVRVGVATQPSDVVLEDPEQADHKRQVTWDAQDVPVTVSLPRHGVLGVCGALEDTRAVGGWVMAQLAVTQSPRDVRLYLLTEPSAGGHWDWVRWLPHVLAPDRGRSFALVGSDAGSVSARLGELGTLIAQRQHLRSSSAGLEFSDPDVVVVLDGAWALRGRTGIAQLLQDGPAVGVYTVCLETEERYLPQECNAVFRQVDGGVWSLRQQREHDVDGVQADLVEGAWCDWVGRAIAPLRDAGDDAESSIPASARFLELIGMEQPSAEAVMGQWARGGRSTEVLLGVDMEGGFSVDLRRDGPHTLVGGTTGAGKSEFLQTLVASLAVSNTPDALNFVLIDYKGGAAFKDCVGLPHTVGSVTDLDAHLVERAIASLAAELRRREHLLAVVGAKDIEDYTEITDRDRAVPKMPRLVLVVDEFAAMKTELPDFVTGIVNIAQRGRSLGIHLVLATQRPSGAITPDIRANTNLRIALRVSDAGDSLDIISAPDAARISQSTPGRGYVRTGAELLRPFQAARVGGRRPSERSGEVPTPVVVPMPWKQLGQPWPSPSLREDGRDDTTDLMVLVERISEAAQRLGIAPQVTPWLPPLPEVLVLGNIVRPDRVADREPGWIEPVVFGLEDLPGQQRQRAQVLDFQHLGHLYVTGSARSGRSQTLRTIAGSVARTVTVDEVHLYGLDFGNGSLLALTDLPHCGAVATRAQPERVERLLDHLLSEVASRQRSFTLAGFANLTEQRAHSQPADRLPHLVVLFDQWEGFLSTLGDGGSSGLAEKVIALLREGASAGVHCVISGDKQLLSARMSSLVDWKLMLRFSDRSDYTLGGLQPRKLPETVPAGRAFAADTAVETQIALLAEDPVGQAQVEALHHIAREAAGRPENQQARHQPLALRTLPTRISLEEIWGTGTLPPAPLCAVLGVGGDRLDTVCADLRTGSPSFLILGSPRSGRSTMAIAMAESLRRYGTELVLIAPHASPLRELTGRQGVRAVLDPMMLDPEELNVMTAEGKTLAVVIDDAELIQAPPVRDWLKAYLRKARATVPDGWGRALIATGNVEDFGTSVFAGWETEMKTNRRGAILSPTGTLQGVHIGISLTRTHLSQSGIPGRALANNGDGILRTIQTPLI